MSITSPEIESYAAVQPELQQHMFRRIWQILEHNVPPGFQQSISYGMPAFCVPLSTYPPGYHCKPGTPLPFISVAAMKSSVNLYHMGLYADASLYDWFASEYLKVAPRRPDMGKSFIRFKKPDMIPEELLAELFGKMSAEEWVTLYEKSFLQK